MPIEFRCPQCNKLLRTGDDTAGRQAQCPACGAISSVPGASGSTPVEADLPQETSDASATAAPSASPTPPSIGPEAGAAPAVPTPADANAAAWSSSNAGNPYRSPTSLVEPNWAEMQVLQEMALQRMGPPSVALMVVSALGFLMSLGVVCIYGIAAAMLLRGNHSFVPPDQDPQALLSACFVLIAIAAVGVVSNIVVWFGAIKMRQLENYGLAVAAAVLSLIPCVSPLCFLGIPFGIWALVVLCDSSVRIAFRR